MLIATVPHKHRSRRSKRKSKHEETTKSTTPKDPFISTQLLSKPASSPKSLTKTKQNIWDRLKEQKSNVINPKKNVMRLYNINSFTDKRDLNHCISIHLTLLDCDLIENILIESTIIKEIAQYSTGFFLNCKDCGDESSILYENVVNEQELRHYLCNGTHYYQEYSTNGWKENELMPYRGQKNGYLSIHYNNKQEKECHNLHYCKKCLPSKIRTAELCHADGCHKPIMDITEKVLQVRQKWRYDDGYDWYHYDCYIHQKKINDEWTVKELNRRRKEKSLRHQHRRVWIMRRKD